EESQIALPNEFLDRPVVGRDAFGPTLNRRDGVPASALADRGPQPDRFKWADWQTQLLVVVARRLSEPKVRSVEPHEVLALHVEDDRLRIRTEGPKGRRVEERVQDEECIARLRCHARNTRDIHVR